MNGLSMPLCLLAATVFYVHKPVVNLREKPTHNSTVVSQTTFSEQVNIENREGEWCFIKTPDGYTGWAESHSFAQIESSYTPSLKVSRLAAHLYDRQDTEFGPIMTLPYSSKLQSLDASDSRWIKVSLPNGHVGFIQKGDVAPEQTLKNKGDLVNFSQRFLGLPYTWGGRSSFGYDCSGFIQMLYNQIGISLERDSKQQIRDNRFQTISIENLEPGDLIFFGKSEQKISHVALFIGDGQFIHATTRECQPWIRISRLSDFEWSGDPSANSPYRVARQLIRNNL